MHTNAYRPDGTVNPDYLGVGDEPQLQNADRRKRPGYNRDSGHSPMCEDTLFTEGATPGDGMEHDQA